MVRRLSSAAAIAAAILAAVYCRESPPAAQGQTQPVVNLSAEKVVQFGLVVSDAEKVAKRFSDIFGVSWRFYEAKPRGLVLRDKPSDGESLMKVAIGDLGGRSIKLIQPVSGPSLYREFLDRHGEGFLYFSLGTVGNHDRIVDALKKAGVAIAMQGRLGTHTTFTIFDTAEDLGCDIEIVSQGWNEADSYMRLTGVHEPSRPGIIDMTTPAFSGGKRINQIGIVVRDEKRVARRYQELLGIGPWSLSSIAKKTDAFLDEKPVPEAGLPGLGNDAAFSFLGDIQFELLKPAGGPSCHRRFLDRRGNGIQHVSVGRQVDYDQVVAALKKAGINSEYSATLGGTSVVNYFAMQEQLGGFQVEYAKLK